MEIVSALADLQSMSRRHGDGGSSRQTLYGEKHSSVVISGAC